MRLLSTMGLIGKASMWPGLKKQGEAQGEGIGGK